MAGALQDIGVDSFDSFISGTEVAVIDFSATWCAPCQRLKPTIESLASDYQGKVNIGKVEIDENQDLASRFNVMSVPTILFFKNGEQADSLLGAVPREAIEKKINDLM